MLATHIKGLLYIKIKIYLILVLIKDVFNDTKSANARFMPMNPLCIGEKIIAGVTEMQNSNEFHMKRVSNEWYRAYKLGKFFHKKLLV